MPLTSIRRQNLEYYEKMQLDEIIMQAPKNIIVYYYGTIYISAMMDGDSKY